MIFLTKNYETVWDNISHLVGNWYIKTKFLFFYLIERADVVREIFFRNSDLEVGENIDLGDNVEFTIQTRNGKEVATNIIKLIQGTVVFEDVGTEYFRGQVLKVCIIF